MAEIDRKKQISSAITTPPTTPKNNESSTIVMVEDDKNKVIAAVNDDSDDAKSDQSAERLHKSGLKGSICACLQTLLGPKAPSFLWCCCCCKTERKVVCSLTSTAAKTMNLLFLLIIVLLSCFFIIPPGKNVTPDVNHVAPAFFFPCGDEAKVGSKVDFNFFKVNGFWGDCKGHAGYFFVYRFFLCLISFYTIMSILTFNVVSTTNNPKRSKLHYGFWIYKLAIIAVLLIVSCLGLRVYGGGIFEYTMMWFGLLGAYFFSFIEMVCTLDALEIIIIKLKDTWAEKTFKITYWVLTVLIYLIGIACIGLLIVFNSSRHFSDELLISENDVKKYFNGIDPEDDSKDTGSSSICLSHLILYIIVLVVGLVVGGIVLAVKLHFTGRRFLNLGLLQASLLFLYTVFLSYSATSNSTDIECRSVFFPYNEYEKNKDVAFNDTGMLHGFIATFAILYYTFSNGPRSKAPWTVAFNKVWQLTTGPPLPPGIETPEPLHSWDDEAINVAYSWPLFYITLILGSFSIMMAMTNYASPWAGSAASGNFNAFQMKLVTIFSCVILFLLPVLYQCPSIYPESEFPIPPLNGKLPSGVTNQELEQTLGGEGVAEQQSHTDPIPEVPYVMPSIENLSTRTTPTAPSTSPI